MTPALSWFLKRIHTNIDNRLHSIAYVVYKNLSSARRMTWEYRADLHAYIR